MKVLLPLDGSESSKKTMAWAAQFFDKQTTAFYLLHVVYTPSEAPMVEFELDLAHAILNEARQEMRSQGCKVAEAKYVLDSPAHGICRYADEVGVEQIVMGSHGHQGLASFLMGSVSQEVFQHAKQPVLVLNNGPKPSLKVSHVDQVPLTERSLLDA